ncbi:MAG: alpha/beta hydrolase [Gammaproteobacteria bacterium]|nr:alpha/beta hydrolase [Gammaproteobacteria bacterium]
MALQHNIPGADGVNLHVREFGNPQGQPLVLIHGWSQSHQCWVQQYDSELAATFRIITPDLRGHGQSDKPLGDTHYTGSRVWAEDLAAVISKLQLERPVLVGWSYGGLVIGHYLKHFGDAGLAGLNFVGAGVRVGTAHIGTLLGETFLTVLPLVTSPDLSANIAGIRQFLGACFTQIISREDWESTLAFNMVVPPAVRAALLAEEVDITPQLATITRPTLMTHGLADVLVLPASGQLLLACCPSARASWYEGVGHGPFLEAPARFNAELAAFARAAVA